VLRKAVAIQAVDGGGRMIQPKKIGESRTKPNHPRLWITIRKVPLIFIPRLSSSGGAGTGSDADNGFMCCS
jgi:hypothetical protein